VPHRVLMQALSLGSLVDVWTPRFGAVHSVFHSAINLRVDAELWTIFDAAGQDAPFGIRLAVDPPHAGFGVRVADRVHVRAGYVGIGQLVLDCRSAPRWTPAAWAGPGFGLEARIGRVERAARPRAWSASAARAREVTDALRSVGGCPDAGLGAAVRRTVGCGPGLTPAGDDVLVGIFTVLVSGAAGSDGLRAAARLSRALGPALLSTTDISRHLLDQAARGLPGRALHELGKALVEGAQDDLLLAALKPVLDTGASSGADACMGLAAASRFSFLSAERVAA
jgi:hypothetical protein